MRSSDGARRFAATGPAMAAAALVLSACQAPPPTAEEVARQAAALPQPEPGLYRSETRLVSFALADGARESQAVEDRLGGVVPQVRTACLGEAEARQGFAPLLRDLQQGQCRFTRFSARGDRLLAALDCRSSGGVVSQIALEGTAAPRSSTVDLTIQQRGQGLPQGGTYMQMQVRSRWLGRCPSA